MQGHSASQQQVALQAIMDAVKGVQISANNKQSQKGNPHTNMHSNALKSSNMESKIQKASYQSHNVHHQAQMVHQRTKTSSSNEQQNHKSSGIAQAQANINAAIQTFHQKYQSQQQVVSKQAISNSTSRDRQHLYDQIMLMQGQVSPPSDSNNTSTSGNLHFGSKYKNYQSRRVSSQGGKSSNSVGNSGSRGSTSITQANQVNTSLRIKNQMNSGSMAPLNQTGSSPQDSKQAFKETPNYLKSHKRQAAVSGNMVPNNQRQYAFDPQHNQQIQVKMAKSVSPKNYVDQKSILMNNSNAQKNQSIILPKNQLRSPHKAPMNQLQENQPHQKAPIMSLDQIQSHQQFQEYLMAQRRSCEYIQQNEMFLQPNHINEKKAPLNQQSFILQAANQKNQQTKPLSSVVPLPRQTRIKQKAVTTVHSHRTSVSPPINNSSAKFNHKNNAPKYHQGHSPAGSNSIPAGPHMLAKSPGAISNPSSCYTASTVVQQQPHQHQQHQLQMNLQDQKRLQASQITTGVKSPAEGRQSKKVDQTRNRGSTFAIQSTKSSKQGVNIAKKTVGSADASQNTETSAVKQRDQIKVFGFKATGGSKQAHHSNPSQDLALKKHQISGSLKIKDSFKNAQTTIPSRRTSRQLSSSQIKQIKIAASKHSQRQKTSELALNSAAYQMQTKKAMTQVSQETVQSQASLKGSLVSPPPTTNQISHYGITSTGTSTTAAQNGRRNRVEPNSNAALKLSSSSNQPAKLKVKKRGFSENAVQFAPKQPNCVTETNNNPESIERHQNKNFASNNFHKRSTQGQQHRQSSQQPTSKESEAFQILKEDVQQLEVKNPNFKGVQDQQPDHKEIIVSHIRKYIKGKQSNPDQKPTQANKEEIQAKDIKDVNDSLKGKNEEQTEEIINNLREFLGYLEKKGIINQDKLKDREEMKHLLKDIIKLDLTKFTQYRGKRKSNSQSNRASLKPQDLNMTTKSTSNQRDVKRRIHPSPATEQTRIPCVTQPTSPRSRKIDAQNMQKHSLERSPVFHKGEDQRQKLIGAPYASNKIKPIPPHKIILAKGSENAHSLHKDVKNASKKSIIQKSRQQRLPTEGLKIDRSPDSKNNSLQTVKITHQNSQNHPSQRSVNPPNQGQAYFDMAKKIYSNKGYSSSQNAPNSTATTQRRVLKKTLNTEEAILEEKQLTNSTQSLIQNPKRNHQHRLSTQPSPTTSHHGQQAIFKAASKPSFQGDKQSLRLNQNKVKHNEKTNRVEICGNNVSYGQNNNDRHQNWQSAQNHQPYHSGEQKVIDHSKQIPINSQVQGSQMPTIQLMINTNGQGKLLGINVNNYCFQQAPHHQIAQQQMSSNHDQQHQQSRQHYMEPQKYQTQQSAQSLESFKQAQVQKNVKQKTAKTEPDSVLAAISTPPKTLSKQQAIQNPNYYQNSSNLEGSRQINLDSSHGSNQLIQRLSQKMLAGNHLGRSREQIEPSLQNSQSNIHFQNGQEDQIREAEINYSSQNILNQTKRRIGSNKRHSSQESQQQLHIVNPNEKRGQKKGLQTQAMSRNPPSPQQTPVHGDIRDIQFNQSQNQRVNFYQQHNKVNEREQQILIREGQSSEEMSRTEENASQLIYKKEQKESQASKILSQGSHEQDFNKRSQEIKVCDTQSVKQRSAFGGVSSLEDSQKIPISLNHLQDQIRQLHESHKQKKAQQGFRGNQPQNHPKTEAQTRAGSQESRKRPKTAHVSQTAQNSPLRRKQSAQGNTDQIGRSIRQVSGQRIESQNQQNDQRNRSKESKKEEITTQSSVTLNEGGISQDRARLIAYIKAHIAKHGTMPHTTLEFYKFVKLLGRGAFGKITLAIHKLTGKYVAIKSIDRANIKDEYSRRKVFQEVYILKKIRHSCVCRLLEVFESEKHFLMVMEFAGGGDLLQYVKKRKRLNEQSAKAIFKQVLYALGHCHCRSVLHRDIKLDNVLMDGEGGVKLCDFGVSRLVKKGQVINEQCGTPAYLAPEIIIDKGYSGFSADIWSLGVLLYAMVQGTVPFKAANIVDLHKLILGGEFEFPVESVSSEVKDLIRKMIVLEPSERISIPQMLNHPWVADVSNQTGDWNALDDDGDQEHDMRVGSSFFRQEVLGGLIPGHNNKQNENGNINFVNVENLYYRGGPAPTLDQPATQLSNQQDKVTYSDYCALTEDFMTYRIEEDAMEIVTSFGYPREMVINSINKGDVNHATAAYYLLVYCP